MEQGVTYFLNLSTVDTFPTYPATSDEPFGAWRHHGCLVRGAPGRIFACLTEFASAASMQPARARAQPSTA